MKRHLAVYFILASLPAGACDCNEARSPGRNAQSPAPSPSTPTTGEATPKELPRPEGTPVPSERIAPLAPDTLAGFSASGPAEPRSTPLPNGGEVTAIRRSYTRDGAKLQLEISDSLHAPGVRQLVSSQQGETRKAARVDYRGMPVAGQPAIVQWHEQTKTAVVNMVVDGRFLANIKVSPAQSAEPAVEFASALPIAAIAKLGAAEPSAP